MLGKTMLPGDEELGKKDDDHKYVPARRFSWRYWSPAYRWRRRRVLLFVVVFSLAYWILSSSGEQGRFTLRRPTYYIAPVYEETEEPRGPPEGIQLPRGTDAAPHTYDGQIRFYRLKSSIRSSASLTNGYEDTNRNILFAMSSLKSAATLLPMICEMSKWNRNHVHAAFMGREDIPLADLLAINGIDEEKCPATWHDARPDYMEYSSDNRAERVVVGAMSHIHSYLHPQAVIMDDATVEDVAFVRGIRTKTSRLQTPLIEIPKGGVDSLSWLTRLDAGSLKNWHSPTIDILIQVPQQSSSVLRLLKSIRDADYSGMRLPHIILELPADLDGSVKRYVRDFKWPSNTGQSLLGGGLSIRRRIANHRATQEDAAIRFLELFYPTSTANSHVLLLSPQTQLSTLYFHYAKYSLLEYKYSKFGAEDSANVMGTSLELPSVLLDGTTKFTPPKISDMQSERYQKYFSKTLSAPFLWQAPNSHATLFFGDKWAELHAFLSRRVSKHQQTAKPLSRSKLVSEVQPAWTEYMLEFMRTRGYSLLYPAKSRETFVTVHNELYHAPEEFTPPTKDGERKSAPPPGHDNEAFLRAETPAPPPKHEEPDVIPGSQPLHQVLPFGGDLPEVPHLPQLLYDGTIVAAVNVSSIAHEYADKFRQEIGGCTIPKGKHKKMVAGEVTDLFCFGDEDDSDWVDDAPTVEQSDGLMVDDNPPRTADDVATSVGVAAVATSTIVADEF